MPGYFQPCPGQKTLIIKGFIRDVQPGKVFYTICLYPGTCRHLTDVARQLMIEMARKQAKTASVSTIIRLEDPVRDQRYRVYGI